MKSMQLWRVLSNLLHSEVGRRHPVTVISRFAALQLRRRLGGSPFVFETSTGTRALVERHGDFSGVTHLYYIGFPDLQETAFACHALRPGEVFWDIGANQGFWSLLLAGRGVEVHAFEPTPVTFRNQAKQFALQASPARELLHGHNQAMASQSGAMSFAVDRGQANYLLQPGENYQGETVKVSVTTMDDFGGSHVPNLIKIDVEGWNVPVLEGARVTLSRPELLGLVIETFRFADGNKPELRRVEAILAEHGFRPRAYDPERRELRELKQSLEGRQDTIYTRDDPRLAERLKHSEPIHCFGDCY
jgi:FkbM family methyltransferase